MKRRFMAGLAAVCCMWHAAQAQDSVSPERRRLYEKVQEARKNYEAASTASEVAVEAKELADYHAIDLAEAAARAHAASDPNSAALATAADRAKAAAEAAAAAVPQAQAKLDEMKKAQTAVNAEMKAFDAANRPPAGPPEWESSEGAKQLQAEVTQAAEQLAAMKAEAADVAAALDEAAAKPAANRINGFDEIARIKETQEEVARRVADAQADLDTKIALLSKIPPESETDTNATVESELAAREKRKEEIEKAAALVQAKEAAKIAAQRKEEAEHEDAGARLWYANSVALANKAHWIAVMQVTPEGKPPVAFRYDHFPSFERVVDADGTSYVRKAGEDKEWFFSKDWVNNGLPAWAFERPAAHVALLDAAAELARRIFEPDPHQGKVLWTPPTAGEGGYTMHWEKPPAGESFPPEVEFSDETHPFYSKDKSATYLRAVRMEWNWKGQAARVAVHYFYTPDETPPPAGTAPEQQLARALVATGAEPVKVDAVINGALRFRWNRPLEKVRVAGIVSGNDFDLTVIKGDSVTRQIAVGNDAWSSDDGGRTWRKLDAADRTYFDAAVSALRNEFTVPWPVSVADVALRPGDAAAAGGETWRRFERKVDNTDSDNSDQYWVAVKDGKPAVLRRYEALSFNAQLYADYGDVPGGQGVLPPPGNPQAVPAARPEELLGAAVSAIKTAGMWKVEYHFHEQTKTGQKDGQDIWKDTKRVWWSAGLISGRDFDLHSWGTDKHQISRSIGVKDTVWRNSTLYPAWQEAVKQPPMGNWFGPSEPPDSRRSEYDSVMKLLGKNFVDALYEAAGTETHDGQTWLHIRLIGDTGLRGRPEYWIQLDPAGRAVALRRYILVTANSGTDRAFQVNEARECEEGDFAPAAENEKIEPPSRLGGTDELAQPAAESEDPGAD